MSMFASKTLEQRNNGPQPYVTKDLGFRFPYSSLVHPCDLDPRPEFQHGELEANPILTALRQYMASRRGNVEAALLALNNSTLDWGASPAQIAHAHRVLTLWLATYGPR